MFKQGMLSVLTLFSSELSWAEPIVDTPYAARLTGQMLAGDHQQLSGFADTLYPLRQNHNNLFFADGSAMFGQAQRSSFSGGLGYRGIRQLGSSQGIWGAYLFTEYYHTRLKNEYWQLNPGVEWLNTDYEFRLQGYIPVSSRQKAYKSMLASQTPAEVLSDAHRLNTFSGATGHQVYDTPVSLVEQFGPGLELEAGKFFPYGQGFWVRAGGYFFSYPKHGPAINGFEANIEAVINKNASLIIQNNYDQQNKNRFSVGLRVTFGGSSAPLNTLENRMTSPIIRHLARQSYGDALPTRQNIQAAGPAEFINNVWFFSPTGTAPIGAATTFANCTAENPCLTIDSPTAGQIAVLSPNANLFFATGDYVIPTSTQNQNNWVNLQNGQSVYGRNTGWVTAAAGTNRPLINGGLVWGNNTTTANGAIYNTQVSNTNQVVPNALFDTSSITATTNDSVLGIAATGNLFVQDSDIQVTNTHDNLNAMAIATFNDATITNSSVSSTNQGNALAASVFNGVANFGVLANNANITGLTVNLQTQGNALAPNTEIFANGVDANNLSISNSTLNLTTSGDAGTGSMLVALALNTGNITVSDTTITMQSSVNNLGGNTSIQGINALGAVVSNSTINIATNGVTTNAGLSNVQSIFAVNDVSITETTMNAQMNGNVDGSGSTLIVANVISDLGGVMITDSTMSAILNSNVTNGASSVVQGVSVATNIAASGSTVNASASGSVNGVGSSLSAMGLSAPSGTVTFQGSTSYVSAISSVLGSAAPVTALSINNASSPSSQCSTDGVNFTNC